MSRTASISAVVLFCGFGVSSAFAADNAAIPNFHIDSAAAWMEIGDELLPPPSGAGPISNDPRYPYVDNGAARRRGIQPTYRVADLSNPILQPWARDAMKKANDD